MSAEIRTLKDGETTVYPRTLASAVYNDDGTTIDTTIQNAINDTTQLAGNIDTILEDILTGDEEDTADFYIFLGGSTTKAAINNMIIIKSNYNAATGSIIGEPYKINFLKSPYIHNNISYNVIIQTFSNTYLIYDITVNNTSVKNTEICYDPINNSISNLATRGPVLLKLNPNDIVKIRLQYD